MTIKMRLKMKNRPRPKHGHKHTKREMCLIIMMVIGIKQHLSKLKLLDIFSFESFSGGGDMAAMVPQWLRPWCIEISNS